MASIQDHEYWRDKLDADTFHITREGGTEYPFTGKLLRNKEQGEYLCICCKQVLFTDQNKYDSGCGWPAFHSSPDDSKFQFIDDHSHGMVRIEVRCANCDSHLGHIFDDGPQPTGKRFCVNSASLSFQPASR